MAQGIDSTHTVGPEAVDSVWVDTLAADMPALPVAGEEMQGLVLVNPASAYVAASREARVADDSTGMSWIFLALAVLFTVIGLKFKGSTRYITALVSDLTDTRVRHNVFDETVRETSLMALLNVMWVACAGIMLWVGASSSLSAAGPDSSLGLNIGPVPGIAVCMAVAAAYLLLMLGAYTVVGNVFSDRRHTTMWIKGAAASTGLQAFLLFPIAVVALSCPQWSIPLALAALTVFSLGKIIFFYQGFRIFFTQIASWLLFLYYLCSLEIIPVVLTYVATLQICSSGL